MMHYLMCQVQQSLAHNDIANKAFCQAAYVKNDNQIKNKQYTNVE
jgi:hypothetical protein